MTEKGFCSQIRKNVHIRMASNGLTIRSVAKKAGLPPTSVQRILDPQRKSSPTYWSLLLLARGLDCDLSDLVS